MDSNSYTPCSNFIDLLNSQQDTVYELVDDSVEVSSSQFSVFSSQATQDETPAERKERRSWTPIDDVALISAWLNTSKDPVVANEQRAGAFWKRIAAYFDAASREKSSSQNETDVLKHAHEIFYNNHKKRFTFEHAWKELRNDEKWCELSSGKTQGNAKRRKCDESAQSSNSHAFETSTGEDEKATIRPPGVKASKGHGKKKMAYPDNLFHRRFRMNKPLFMKIVDRLSNEMKFFQQKQDGLGRLSLSTLQKCTAAIRVLAYGHAADAVDEYLRLGSTTTPSCLENFVEGIINFFRQ
ncbi:PREDICTED: glutathione S-transferase T3-like [Brassica oleracea var. oleracea]|uniref:glutathione S-transferase T3-like n=1 Tax=Brassica oleracea var. oleracea TaxID=109376 RepID=UPI0006A6A6E8|nr:PREDICTED: glutathione S-transferase T3-like [Brassica oleracea var. oleracea]